MLKKLRAQSLVEYTLLLSVVVVVAVMMFPMVKRSSQSLIGTLADQIGDQRNAEQSYTYNDSYLVESLSDSKSRTQTDVYDRYGVVRRVYGDLSEFRTVTLSNTGFTEQEKRSPTDKAFLPLENAVGP